jgi:hypothetical protein
MKKLIITAILTAILPVFLASAEDKNDNGNPPDGKPKQCEGGKGQNGKCNGKNGNGKPKKGKPGEDGAPKTRS